MLDLCFRFNISQTMHYLAENISNPVLFCLIHSTHSPTSLLQEFWEKWEVASGERMGGWVDGMGEFPEVGKNGVIFSDPWKNRLRDQPSSLLTFDLRGLKSEDGSTSSG